MLLGTQRSKARGFVVFAVVTGGGTSGHFIPAQAILESLMESGIDSSELRYVGSRRGVEQSLMNGSPIEAEYLPISGLQRSLSLKGIARNLVLPVRLLRSRLLARTLIRQWKPRVVVSVGGYASEPMSAAAIAAGVPLVCVSYDRMPGLATRRQAKHAAVSAIAFPGVNLPRAVVTGAPVRSALRHLDVVASREAAREELGVKHDALLVTVMGGSLGSGVLNTLVPSMLEACAEIPQIHVLHICGKRFIGEASPSVPAGVVYQRVGYESRMAQVYAASDLLVVRAGASTVAEIVTIGIAAVVVPWEVSADGHQKLNAQWLADADAAYVVTEAQCSDGSAVTTIVNVLRDSDARERVASNARGLGEAHRSSRLVDVIRNAAL
jgi:UDP-N-acetylglucosamine--N-acetylmuramyl-(pentapeptide) pyrophosphoryl-undecaprenol N-acetylglucosamine transferase